MVATGDPVFQREPVRRKESGLVRDEGLERFIGQFGRGPACLRSLPGYSCEADLVSVRADDDRFNYLRGAREIGARYNRRLCNARVTLTTEARGSAPTHAPAKRIDSALRARISLAIRIRIRIPKCLFAIADRRSSGA